MNDRGLLVVLSGFSGSGKGTIMKRLLEKYDCYALSVSATTRSPRPGEAEGVHYFFKTQEEFTAMIGREEFLEYATYVNNSYGTPRAYVEEKLSEGKDVILEIEIQGALKVRERFPETLLIFVTPPSAKILADRLAGRGTETPEVIASRLSRAAEEADYMKDYDFILVNDDLEECVDTLHHLIRSQHLRSLHQDEFINKITKELKEREENV